MPKGKSESALARIHEYFLGKSGWQRWACACTTVWKLAGMNLAICSIESDFCPEHADKFRQDDVHWQFLCPIS